MKTRESNQSQVRANARRKVDEIQLTPMIDVVFQLLVFFVFTFESVHVMADLPVNRPAAPFVDAPPPPGQVRIHVGSDTYQLMDHPLTLEHLDQCLGRLAALDTNQLIIVQASEISKHDRLITALDLCAKHKLTRISLLSVDD